MREDRNGRWATCAVVLIALGACQGEERGSSADAGTFDVAPDDAKQPSDADPDGSDAVAEDVDSGAEPVWEPMATGLPGPCEVRVLSNPADVGPSIALGSCSDSFGSSCSKLTISEVGMPAGGRVVTAGVVEDGEAGWLHSYSWNDADESISFVTRLDGVMGAAIRLASMSDCQPTTFLGAGRLGFSVLDIHNRDAGVSRSVVFLLGGLEPSAKLTLSPVVEEGPGILIASNTGAFANGRMAFVWGPMGVKLASIDAVDGTGYTVFDPPSMDREWHRLAGFPGLFLAGRSDADGRSIWSSDGVSEPVPYLGGDGEGAAFPLYLDSSIVWERGFNQSGSKFDRVELWASPFSPDPSQLEPFKVADLPLTTTSHAVGGSGYYAAGLDMQTVLLTHLPDGEQRVLRVPTTHRLVAPLLGIANGELYTLIRKLESSDPDIYRFAIDGLPVFR